jgi:hypothetical protein
MDTLVNDNSNAKELAKKWLRPGPEFHNPGILNGWFRSKPVTIGPQLEVNLLYLSKRLSNVKLTSNGLIVQKIFLEVPGHEDAHNYKIIGKFDFDTFDKFKFDKVDNDILQIDKNKKYNLKSYFETTYPAHTDFPVRKGNLDLI